MEYHSQFIFKGDAETYMSDKEGVVEFRFPQGHQLMLNETVTFRVAPEKEPMTFVCIGRHYDFSEERKCTLYVELDLA